MGDGRANLSSRRGRSIAGLLALAALGVSAWAQKPASLDQLYAAARRADAAKDAKAYEAAAGALVERGSEAAQFLVAKAEVQALHVRSAEDVEASGIRVTINLLGWMNAYREARSALLKLQPHPVKQVGQWAGYALRATPRTRPTATRPSRTRPATTASAPVGRRAASGRIETPDGWFAVLPRKGPPRPDKPTRVFVIPVREEIKTKTFKAMERKALRCRSAGADLVILDMDTFGGGVIAALNIARLLKVELADIYTVCYARTRAISAGALIALACNEIVMTPVGKLGDCAPIVMGGKLEGVEREKGESPLRTEFAESAQDNGYPIPLAESMVTMGRAVWLIRNKGTRELRYVLGRDWRGRVDAPEGLTTAPSAPASEWELLRVVVPGTELLTMRPKQALEYGFASRLIAAPLDAPLKGILADFGAAGAPTVLGDTWSEKLVGILTSPAVVGFLFFVAILCAYVEMHTPGFGIAGAVAIACFAILFGANYLIGLSQVWEIALFGVGVVLLVVELFIPGFGVFGIAGILCCVAGLLAMLIPNAPGKWPVPSSPLEWDVFARGLFAVLAGAVAATIAGALLAKHLPKMPLAKRLVLPAPAGAGGPPVPDASPMQRIAVGATGVVEGVCRPVGKVRFGDDLLDAMTEGDTIEAGAAVRVIRREGNRLVVEKA